MSKYLIACAIACVLTVPVFMGCRESAGNKMDEAKASMEKIRQDMKDTEANYMDDWQDFKNQSLGKINANENKLQIFRDKMEKSSSDVKTKYNAAVVDLEHQNRELKDKMVRYKKEGKARWDTFKSEFNRDMDKVEASVNDLTAEKF
jgi:hypothetical protein